MDLIYEGITTFWCLHTLRRRSVEVRKDLIYEGITTRQKRNDIQFSMSQKGPDLRRDYDITSPHRHVITTIVRKDLIYEGITTSEWS